MRSTVLLVGVLATTFTSMTFHARAEAPADQGTTISVMGKGEMEVPEAFKRVQPKMGMIEHEFQAKTGEGKEGETARVTMMRAMGGATANIARWNSQFTGGDQKARKAEQMKLGDWEVHIVDVNGKYAERMGGPFAGGKTVVHDDYAMTGAILIHPEGGQYFVKMIGPAKVIKENREALVKMIKSIDK